MEGKKTLLIGLLPSRSVFNWKPKDLKLSDRTYNCDSGNHDRDLNAYKEFWGWDNPLSHKPLLRCGSPHFSVGKL